MPAKLTVGGLKPEEFTAALPAMPKAGRTHYLDESDALDEHTTHESHRRGVDQGERARRKSRHRKPDVY
jgi:hypothetical protein